VRQDVSRDEAKAARLRRYAELRWSVDTSPALSWHTWYIHHRKHASDVT